MIVILGRRFRLAAAAVAAGVALLSATAASAGCPCACGYGYGNSNSYYGYNYGYGSAYYPACGAGYVSEPSYPVDQGPVYAAPAATAVEVTVEHDPRSYPYVQRRSYGYGHGYGYGPSYGYRQGYGYSRGYGYGRGYSYSRGYRYGYGHRHRPRLGTAPHRYRHSVYLPPRAADRGYRTAVDRREVVTPRRGAAAPVVVRERRREGPRPELEGGPIR
jgi:hypothetical protein